MRISKDFVSNAPLFRSMTLDEIKQFLKLCSERVHEEGVTVISQGSRNDTLFVVKTGKLKVVRRVKTRELTLAELGPGSFFGEVAVLDPGPAAATVRSVSQSEVLAMSGNDLDDLLKKHPTIAAKLFRNMLEEVVKRVRNSNQKLSDVLLWGTLPGNA